MEFRILFHHEIGKSMFRLAQFPSLSLYLSVPVSVSVSTICRFWWYTYRRMPYLFIYRYIYKLMCSNWKMQIQRVNAVNNCGYHSHFAMPKHGGNDNNDQEVDDFNPFSTDFYWLVKYFRVNNWFAETRSVSIS